MQDSVITREMRALVEDPVWIETIRDDLRFITSDTYKEIEQPVRDAAEDVGIILANHISMIVYDYP